MSTPATGEARRAARPGSAGTFLFRTLEFTCRAETAESLENAIDTLIRHADSNEPGTRFVASFRDADDPYRFLITSVFEDTAAEHAHDASPASRRLQTMLRVAANDLRVRTWEADAGL